MTTNRGIASWGQMFNDDSVVAAAMLHRLLHRSTVVSIDGDSYRMRAHRARIDRLRRGAAEAAYGPDHPSVATNVNNLAMVLKDLGDLAGAWRGLERALRIIMSAWSPDHPRALAIAENLQSLD